MRTLSAAEPRIDRTSRSVCAWAVRAAVERLDASRNVPRDVVLEPRLVVRGTTARAAVGRRSRLLVMRNGLRERPRDHRCTPAVGADPVTELDPVRCSALPVNSDRRAGDRQGRQTV